MNDVRIRLMLDEAIVENLKVRELLVKIENEVIADDR